MSRDIATQVADDGIATLTLNLPAKLNPIALELQRELRDALSAAVTKAEDQRAG